jgi:5-methylcytosine-specific restriction endonuclease McrA
MKEFYIESARLTDATGIKHNVDHIVPIVHPLVCGLHNEFNLQVLTRDDNIRKSNEFNIE